MRSDDDAPNTLNSLVHSPAEQKNFACFSCCYNNAGKQAGSAAQGLDPILLLKQICTLNVLDVI